MNNVSTVIGSTGLVGRNILIELSKRKIPTTSLSRKENINLPDNIRNLKIDFDSYLKKDYFPDCDHIYLCLGTTMSKAGSKSEFKKVDYDYSLAFAKKAYMAGAKKISLVSSVGANHNSKNFYLRTKGELEEAIKKINFNQINIYRPSLLIGKRNEIRLFEQLGQNCSFIINQFLWGSLKKYRSIRAKKLAEYIVRTKNKNGVNYFYFEDYSSS